MEHVDAEYDSVTTLLADCQVLCRSITPKDLGQLVRFHPTVMVGLEMLGEFLFGKPEPVLQGISLWLAPLDGWFLNLVCKSNTAGLSRFMVACVFGAICLEPGQLEVDHLEETQTYIPLKYISLFTKVFEPQIYLNIVS